MIMKKRWRLNIGLLLLLLCLLAVIIKIQTRTALVLPAKQITEVNYGRFFTPVVKAAPVDDQVATREAILGQQLGSQAAIAVDVNSKQILFAKNPDLPLYPASTTKIITALVARELYDPATIITITPGDLAQGNNLGWQVGEQFSVTDVLRSLLITSANEAGTILANHNPAGYADFITQMNQKALSLGLTRSRFTNPQGYDDSSQQTTARDLTYASLALLQDPLLSEIVATAQINITNLAGKTYQLTSTNQLHFRTNLSYQVKGLKTGTERLARQVLTSVLQQDEQQILIVVLSAQNRYNDTLSVADFVFTNYLWPAKQKN
jgi:D-alanyl-D-alanine carboxypeptidase (penicillin-binding protein 5/6)